MKKNKEFKILFNKPLKVNKFLINLNDKYLSNKTSGRGFYTSKIENFLEKLYKTRNSKVLLTTSCTHALEASAILLNLKKSDEIIVPSYTFVSTALSFFMHGAKIRFCDVGLDLNINPALIEKLINKNTKAIVVVHYGGFACDMSLIMKLAKKYKLYVIEDNAHGLFGKYKGKELGTFGDLSTLSFHETKNIACGEGGALVINNKNFYKRAKLIIEKGTNRIDFHNGNVNKYSWIDKGSSYIMSEILAFNLYNNIKNFKKIQIKRSKIWNFYFYGLAEWAKQNNVKLPNLSQQSSHSSHLFYLIFPSKKKLKHFVLYMQKKKIQVASHYLPLNKSKFYKKRYKKNITLINSENFSETLIRLPLYYNLNLANQKKIINEINKYDV